MQSSQLPYKFAEIWAAAAAVGYINTPIPDTSSGTNASQHLGFPPITATPIGSGGVPPIIADFNGVFQYVTQWIQWVQAGGGIVAYDSTFSTNIGGYWNGAIVQSATTPGLIWRCTADNNTSNPDTGGANWVRFLPGSNIAVYKVISGTQQVSINGAAFTATGATTFGPIPNTAKVRAWGGGGGGGGSNGTGASGSGGGGGGYVEGIITATTALTIVAGSPGAAGSGSPTAGNGGNGGNSTIAGITAGGGGGGFGDSGGIQPTPGAAGTASGGTFMQNGANGYVSFSITTPGGAAVFALGGGAAFGTGIAGTIITGAVFAGAAGYFPGQGGAPGINGGAAGSGSSGIIIVEW